MRHRRLSVHDQLLRILFLAHLQSIRVEEERVEKTYQTERNKRMQEEIDEIKERYGRERHEADGLFKSPGWEQRSNADKKSALDQLVKKYRRPRD